MREGRAAASMMAWLMMVAAFTWDNDSFVLGESPRAFAFGMEQNEKIELSKTITRNAGSGEIPAAHGEDLVISESFAVDLREENTDAGWQSVEEELTWEYESSLSDRRMRMASKAAGGRSSWLTADVQCLVARHTNVTSQMRLLEWLCSGWGANHDCSGIAPGGSHYLQMGHRLTDQVLKHHLEWALSSYHETHMTDAYPYQTCWFRCSAYLNPPPLNFFFLGIVHNVHGLESKGFFSPDGLRVCQDDVDEGRLSIRSNESLDIASDSVTVVRNTKAKSLVLNLQFVADTKETLVIVEILFDFDGNGHIDKVVKMRGHKVSPMNRRSYQWVAVFSPEDKTLKNFVNGKFIVRVLNAGEHQCTLYGTSTEKPSHLFIPYFAY
eukprot:765605-Hanusia_phi.AAC.1